MRNFVLLFVSMISASAHAEDCPVPPEKGGSVLLYLEGRGADASRPLYKFRQCLRIVGDRRELRTLGAKGGFTASSVTEGKTVIDTTYAVDGVAGRDKVIRREFSRDVLAINALKPGERRAYEVKQEDEYGERTSKQSRRAVAARAVRIGACSMEVIETEHFIDLQRGWTQTNHVLISPALDYAVQLELGPLVRGSDVRNQYSNFWRVIGFGSRDEARKLCDDFVS